MELKEEVPRSDTFNPVAVDLGLADRTENPQAFTEVDRYTELLKLIYKFNTNELEATEFEDKVRSMYWTGGFIIFTVDKLVAAITKQVLFFINSASNYFPRCKMP